MARRQDLCVSAQRLLALWHAPLAPHSRHDIPDRGAIRTIDYQLLTAQARDL